MSVTSDELRRIAALAALRVDDDAMPELVDQVTRILDYVSQIAAVDGSDTKPFRPQSNTEPQALRLDVAVPHQPPLNLRAFAPDVRDGLVVVPVISGLDEGGES